MTERFQEGLLCLLRGAMHQFEHFVEVKKSELAWNKSLGQQATKKDLIDIERHIMGVLNDYLKKQQEWNTRQGAAIDSAVASLDGLVLDVKNLNDKIIELQNSPGVVTPEDQALIDQQLALGEAATIKVEAFANALKALDHQNTQPPAVPAASTVPPNA